MQKWRAARTTGFGSTVAAVTCCAAMAVAAPAPSAPLAGTSTTAGTPKPSAVQPAKGSATTAGAAKVPVAPQPEEASGKPAAANDATKPAAANDPTKPAAANDPTKPAAANDPTKPAAANDPTKPAAANDPTKPAAANDPTKPAAANDATAEQFVQLCAGCHTIGGGVMRAPDLATVAAWPEQQLSSAVRSMERKVGPLTTAQVDALVALLKDAAAKDRVAAARLATSQVSAKPTEPPDSRLGGAIFFGHVALERGGMPCSACHRFRGEGGSLGPDLSHFAADTDIEVLAGTIARASFPVMRTAYETHPITHGEARHIAAFMKQAKAPRIVAAFANTTSWGLGAGLCAFALALAYALGRPSGVRARLVRRMTKR